MLATCHAGLLLFDGGISSKAPALIVLFTVCAFVAWPFGLAAARFLALGSHPAWRFTASLASLAAATTGLTALVFSQQYRHYYAQWHKPIYTIGGAMQFTETSLSAIYQFLILGLRLYLPLGPLFLIAASLWLTRRMR